MAYASSETTATAGQTTVTVPFPYLEKIDVHLEVNAIEQGTETFTWISASVIGLGTPLVGGEVVRVSRVTPADASKVIFAPGNLNSKALNSQVTQLLYIVQESFDKAAVAALGPEEIIAYLEQAQQVISPLLAARDSALSLIAVQVALAAGYAATLGGFNPASLGNRKWYASWTLLSAVSGTAGEGYEVVSSDTGTHSGYIYGTNVIQGAVPNAGVYIWDVGLSAPRWFAPSSVVEKAAEYGIFLAKTDGTDIVTGGYIVALSTPNSGSVQHFFAKVMAGTGSFDFSLVRDGVVVYGPITVKAGFDFEANVPAISIPVGSDIRFYIENVINVSSLWTQTDGSF